MGGKRKLVSLFSVWRINRHSGGGFRGSFFSVLFNLAGFLSPAANRGFLAMGESRAEICLRWMFE